MSKEVPYLERCNRMEGNDSEGAHEIRYLERRRANARIQEI